jgi:hypothetical protein
MAIEAGQVRKTVMLSWNPDVATGRHATILADNPATGDDGEAYDEKKQVDNTGKAPLSFPLDYDGDCDVIVRGSSGGEEGPARITIEGAEASAQPVPEVEHHEGEGEGGA